MDPSVGFVFDHTLTVAVLRLLVAGAAGVLIGWNRYRCGKPAGTGTHTLVALGAALFVLVPSLKGADVTHVIQGIVTGVGFLGAGEIFRDGNASSRVHGLTSATSLWVTAALGMLAGIGSAALAIVGALVTFLVLWVTPRIERHTTTMPPSPPVA